jgi:hypothetical protein
MTTSRSESGSCLCGKVTLHASNVNPKFSVCHCAMCRTWGGGPFFALRSGTEVQIEGEENITVFTSSSWASRGFCSHCGTHLFYRLNQTGEYNVPTGFFSKAEGLEMNMQYFSDKRPSYYCFSNQTNEMTEAEIMAYFAKQ